MIGEGYVRVIVDPPIDANQTGPYLARTPYQIREMQRLYGKGPRHGGIGAREIARRFKLSYRTVHRYLFHRAFVDVRIGDWSAIFSVRRSEPPTQATRWAWLGEGPDPRDPEDAELDGPIGSR